MGTSGLGILAPCRARTQSWNAGDLRGAAQSLDPDVEWRMPSNFPEVGVYRGREEVIARLEEFRRSWTEFRIVVEELIDSGEQVVALTRFFGRSELGLQLSGSSVDAQVWTFREGRAVSVRMHPGTEEALKLVHGP